MYTVSSLIHFVRDPNPTSVIELKEPPRVNERQYGSGSTDLDSGISSTRLMLNVEVTALEGTLAINIPPPPSDRLWSVDYRVRDEMKGVEGKGVG